ncbi:MAG: ABC transporter permease [Spirochaetales bacterium]|nr:ABC transporter permease [Spirochaetales bacterium]
MTQKQANNVTLVIVFLAVTAVMSIFLPDKFLTVINFQSIVSQFPEYGLMALGIMLAMTTGGIDLSLVSITSISGVTAATVLVQYANWGLPPTVVIILAIVAALAVAAACGILNGLLITFANVPAIIATLGTNGLFLGIAIVVTKGSGISGFPEEFLVIGNGRLLGIPVPFLIFIGVAVLVGLLMNRSRLGFEMRMLGASPTVSQFSSVNNRAVLIKTHILTALMAGIASIIIISRVNSMRPGYGSAYLLITVLIVVLGGTDPAGGFSTTLGTVLAIVTLQVLTSGLNILAFTPFFRKFIWGLLLLGVMVIHYYRRRYYEKRVTQAARNAPPTPEGQT